MSDLCSVSRSRQIENCEPSMRMVHGPQKRQPTYDHQCLHGGISGMAAAYCEAAYITRTIRFYFVLPNWSPALLIVSLISQVTSMCPMRESGPCVNESAGVRQTDVPVICIMAWMISNCTFCDSKVLREEPVRLLYS